MAPRNEVKVTFTADVRDLLQKDRQIQTSQDAIQRELAETARAADRADRQLETSASRVTRSSERNARNAARTARQTGMPVMAGGVVGGVVGGGAVGGGGGGGAGRKLTPYDVLPLGMSTQAQKAVRRSGVDPYGLRGVGKSTIGPGIAGAFAAAHSPAMARRGGTAAYEMAGDWQAINRAKLAELAHHSTYNPWGPGGFLSSIDADVEAADRRARRSVAEQDPETGHDARRRRRLETVARGRRMQRVGAAARYALLPGAGFGGDLRSGIGGQLAAVAGGAIAISTAREMFLGAFQNMEELGLEAMAFEKQMTPLLALNDNSASLGNIRRNKERVLSLSTAAGLGTDAAAASIFNLLGALPQHGDREHRAATWQAQLLTEVKGGSLDENISALARLQATTGLSFREVANLAAGTEEEGALDMDKLAEKGGQAFKTFTEAGYSPYEAAAAIQIGTLTLDEDMALRQARNLPGRLLTGLQKRGITPTGNFATDFESLLGSMTGTQQERYLQLQDVFDQQGVVLASTLAGRMDQFRRNVGVTKEIATGDYLYNRYTRRLDDPAMRGAMSLRAITSTSANVRTLAANNMLPTVEADSVMRWNEEWQATQLGLQIANADNPWVSQEMQQRAARLQVTGDRMDGTIDGSKESFLGHTAVLGQLISSAEGLTGDERTEALVQARLYEMRHSRTLGIKDDDGSFMDGSDIREALEINKAYGVVPDAANLREYHRLQREGGQSVADRYISRLAPVSNEELAGQRRSLQSRARQLAAQLGGGADITEGEQAIVDELQATREEIKKVGELLAARQGMATKVANETRINANRGAAAGDSFGERLATLNMAI